MRKRIPVAKKPPTLRPSLFNVVTLQNIADDLASGKIPLKHGRQVVSDDMEPGLKANVFKNYWAYIVEYKVAGKDARSHITIGEHPVMPISEAREIAKVIRYLGKKGIDVQDGLRARLIAELKRDGIQWRGGMAPKP